MMSETGLDFGGKKRKARENRHAILVLCLMTMVMAFGFWAEKDADYATGSDYLVTDVMTVAMSDLPHEGRRFGLGTLSTPAPRDAFSTNAAAQPEQELTLGEYQSQIGLQGWVFYYLSKFVPRPLGSFHFGCLVALSLVLSAICLQLYKKYGPVLAACFYFVTLFSPWVANFAQSLYWVAFTWFLPMLLGLICLNHLEKRRLLYPLFFLAILLKCACGYEYITVIMLGSVLFLLAEWFCALGDKRLRRSLFQTILAIGILSLLAFIVAVLIHAAIRGNGNVGEGVRLIYENDVLRRTFGNAANFDPIYKESLEASVMKVFSMYFGIGSNAKDGWIASITLLISCAAMIFQFVRRRRFNVRDLSMLAVSFLACISWFVLGKSHSFIHTHLNYVMWYMGYMQISVYIPIRIALEGIMTKEQLHSIAERAVEEVSDGI